MTCGQHKDPIAGYFDKIAATNDWLPKFFTKQGGNYHIHLLKTPPHRESNQCNFKHLLILYYTFFKYSLFLMKLQINYENVPHIDSI